MSTPYCIDRYKEITLAERYANPDDVYYVFKTHCYSEKAMNFVKAFIHYSNDWNLKCYGSYRNRFLYKHCLIDREPDGEIVIRVHKRDYNYFDDMHKIFFIKAANEASIRHRVAACFKELCLFELAAAGIKETEGKTSLSVFSGKSSLKLKLKSDENTTFKVAVAEAYAFYEMLLGRRHTLRKVGAKTVAEVVGCQVDPITAAIEASRRERLLDLKKKRAETLEALHKEKDAEISRRFNEVCMEVNGEYEAKCQAAIAEFDKKYKELSDACTCIVA